MRKLRRFLFPLRLARSRLGAGRERLALVAIGIVIGSAALAAVLGGRLVMQDRALAQATAKLSPADKSLAVSWFGDFGPTWKQLDARVEPAAKEVTGRTPVPAMLYREASIGGRFINLRGADDVARWVRLRSGRLPRTCVPTHCEVLRLSGAGPIPSTPDLNLIEVGRATLLPGTPFASFVQPASDSSVVNAANQYHRPAPAPVVLAEGIDGLSRTPELATFFRAYAWFVPVSSSDVHPWSVDAYAHSAEVLRAKLSAVSDQFQVEAPTDDLTAAVATGRIAARRLLLLGGEAAALLLAFTVLAAASLRREVADSRRRLAWAGARRWQVELRTFGETAIVALLATAVGWALGSAVAAGVASRAGSPPGEVVSHALLSAQGLLVAGLTAAGAALLLYLAVRAPAVQAGRVAITPLDVAAIGAVVVVGVGYSRGSVDTSALSASGGTGAFALLVPALVTFACAVAGARLVEPGFRALGRLGRRGPISVRFASLSLARNPGAATVVTTFLVASLGLSLFAAMYRSTLLQGQRDEAAYAAPAPYVVDEDLSQLIPVRHALPRTAATQVVRATGSVPSAATFTLLGIPAAAIRTLGGWRSDFSADPLSTLAAGLTPPVPEQLRTTALPTGKNFTLPVSTSGDDVSLRAFFISPLGDFDSVRLGSTDGERTVLLHGAVPFPGARLSSLELELNNGGRHSANAGTGIQPTALGTLHLGAPQVSGRPVDESFARWVGVGGAQSAGGNSIRYSIAPDRTAVFRPRQPTDGLPLPVLVTPGVAAAADANGIVPLRIQGSQVTGRIVGIVHRFPSITGDAVIADQGTVATTLNTLIPGAGRTNELWAQTLPSPAPTDVLVTSRSAVLASLEADPLARGALATLGATAGLALLLALAGLLLGVASDRRDERGELFDLEAQGASPASLRLHLRLRALLVACCGVVGGLITGAILSALVLSLVSVTASAAKPEPPLRLALDPELLGLAALAYIVVVAILIVLATRLGGATVERSAEAAA